MVKSRQKFPPSMTPPLLTLTYQINFYLQNVAKHAQFYYFSECHEAQNLGTVPKLYLVINVDGFP